MAVLATVTFHWQDAAGKTTTRSYKARSNEPSDANIQALAADAQALSAWSLIRATVTREVDITAQSQAAEAKSSRQRDASLVYNPTSVQDASTGGTYTFKMPQFKDALLNAADEVDDLTATVFDNWTENFDDGQGVAGVPGSFYAGNQQQLIEESQPSEGFQNKN